MIEKIKILPVSFPLKNSFITALGKKDFTRNVIVILETGEGISGYGEASSSLAMPEATQESMVHILESARGEIVRQPASRWLDACRALKKKQPHHSTAISALECALLDLHCRKKNIPLHKFFGNKNKKIETYFTIPALDIQKCKSIVKEMARKGFKRFKVKTTKENLNENFSRVRLIKEMVGRSSIIVDANQAWDRTTALKFIEKLSSHNLPVSFIEQPLFKGDIAGLKFVKERSPIPVAVDESFRTLKDVQRIVSEDAADIFNIKIAKSGLWESMNIVKYLKKMGKKMMIGCMMESSIGLSTSVHWACGSGDFDFIDLDSFLLLKKLPFQPGFQNRGASLFTKPNLPGAGITIKESSLFQ